MTDWLVVARHCRDRDRRARGEIVRRGLDEKQARQYARSLDPNGTNKTQYLAIQEKEYEND